jgi:hypothetical protein
MRNGFFHVDVNEQSRKYTAFVTEDGQYEYNKLPFGFANSPSIFVKYINKVLSDLVKKELLIVFIDDILISSETIDEHLSVLKIVFNTLAVNHIKLRLEKCKFLKTSIEFLGYRISFNKIMPSDKHVETVKNYPIPIDSKGLHRYLGFVSYFRKFIEGFNRKSVCLYDLLKRSTSNRSDFKFEDVHYKAFNELNTYLIEQPVLAIYSPSAETQLHTDASSRGYGGILLQRQNDNKFHPIAFFSRKTTEAESRLHSFELEVLAVVYSVQRFRPYLFGIRFTLITDCKAMELTLNKRDINPKIARWSIFLENFDFEKQHRSGDKMAHVDALSRIEVFTVEANSSVIFENNICINL